MQDRSKFSNTDYILTSYRLEHPKIFSHERITMSHYSGFNIDTGDQAFIASGHHSQMISTSVPMNHQLSNLCKASACTMKQLHILLHSYKLKSPPHIHIQHQLQVRTLSTCIHLLIDPFQSQFFSKQMGQMRSISSNIKILVHITLHINKELTMFLPKFISIKKISKFIGPANS